MAIRSEQDAEQGRRRKNREASLVKRISQEFRI